MYAIDRNLTNMVKFAAAVTVVLHHYSQYVSHNNLSDSIVYDFFNLYGGYFAVGVFFFLSGFGLMESEKKKHLELVPFLKKRWLRVYIPVLLVTVIWMLVRQWLPEKVVLPRSGVIGVLYDFLWGFGDSYLWFVRVIIFLYAAFAVFAQVRVKHGMARAMLVLNLMTVAVSVGVLIMIADWAIVSIPMFTLGVQASCYAERRRGRAYLALSFMSWCIVVSALLALYYIIVPPESFSVLRHVLANYPSVLVLMLLLPVVPAGWCKHAPRLVADTSYDIYLVHGKVLMTLRALMPVVPLWMLAAVVFVCVVLFYGLRKRVETILKA